LIKTSKNKKNGATRALSVAKTAQSYTLYYKIKKKKDYIFIFLCFLNEILHSTFFILHFFFVPLHPQNEKV